MTDNNTSNISLWLYLSRLLGIFARHKTNMLFMTICIGVITLLNFALPFLTRILIDEGFGNTDFTKIAVVSFMMLGLHVGGTVFEFLKEHIRISIYNDVYFTLQKNALEHLMRIKMSYFHDKTASGICRMLDDDVASLAAIADDETFETITGLFSAVGGSIALFCIDRRLGLAVLLFIPIQYFSNMFMVRMNVNIVSRYNTASQEYSSSLGSTIEGMTDVRFLGIKSKRLAIMTQCLSEMLKLDRKKFMLIKANFQMQYLLTEILIFTLYIISGLLMFKSSITLGGVIAFQTFALMMINPLCQAIELIFSMSSIVPSLERYYSFMDEEEETSRSFSAVSAPQTGSIEFADTAFSYIEGSKILEHVNFMIPYGAKVAIIGANGAGKTTLLNLILRVIEPSSGAVKLNDIDIAEFNIDEYRGLFAVVTQNPYIFNMTLKENICISSGADSSKFMRAVILSGLEELVNARGADYATGRKGAMLSGGQGQKIALARMLMQDRPYVILDEADSHLDRETVKLLYSLFSAELSLKTVICVTHGDIPPGLFSMVIRVEDSLVTVSQ